MLLINTLQESESSFLKKGFFLKSIFTAAKNYRLEVHKAKRFFFTIDLRPNDLLIFRPELQFQLKDFALVCNH